MPLAVENDNGLETLLHQRDLRFRLRMAGWADKRFLARHAPGDGAPDCKRERARRLNVRPQTIFRSGPDRGHLQRRVFASHCDHRRVRPQRGGPPQKFDFTGAARSDIDDERIEAGLKQRREPVIGMREGEMERPGDFGNGKVRKPFAQGA